MIPREQLGDSAAPVAAVRGIPLVAKHSRHQLVPQIANLEKRHAAIREPISRNARDDDVERVCDVATVASWIGEHRNDLREPQERIRKAVCQHDRQRTGPAATFANEVNVLAAEIGAKMVEFVDCDFLSAPIEIALPVVDELAQVFHIESALPSSAARLVDPARARKATSQVFKHGLGDLHREPIRTVTVIALSHRSSFRKVHGYGAIGLPVTRRRPGAELC